MDLPSVASKLDGAVGLDLTKAENELATLRLDPGEIAVVAEEELTYLHGGALATCIDAAPSYAAASATPGDSVLAGLQPEHVPDQRHKGAGSGVDHWLLARNAV